MQVTFGKHVGKSVELLMIKEPNYISWILGQDSPRGAMAKMKSHVEQLIYIFDAKPFTEKKCYSATCSNQATRLTMYEENLIPLPFWWCDTCDPYQTGANRGKLRFLMGYLSALQYVRSFCGGKKSDYVTIIKRIAQSKGLPHRVGELQVQKFFKD